jgi:outer membrane receptor for monomeric catechols
MKKFIKDKIQYILITLCLLSVSNTTGQENQDQEGWSSVELNIKATKKISFSVSEHLRYRNDITTLKNHFTQFKVNYKIFKNFELGGGVRYITKNDDVGNIQGNKSLFRYQFDAGFAKKNK